jgi:competence protein ComEC
VGALVALAGGGRFVLHVAGFLASLLLAFVDAVAAHAPIVTVAAPSKLVLLVSCAGMLWAALSSRRRLHRLALVAGVVLALLGAERLWAWARPAVEVVFLDVGQGDAGVAFLPGGEVIVIDGGPDPRAQVLVPFLRRRGVRRVDLVVLSHQHPDHAGGLAELLRQFPIGELWTNGRESEDPAVRALLAEAAARHVPLGAPGSRRWGEVTLDVLAPRDAAGAVVADPLDAENDASLVLRLRYGGRAVLFAGDIEAAAEAALVARAPGAVDVLKVPHHGSRTSSSEELLEALRPRWAVASLADGNRYRFPHPDVVARYREHGVSLLRTDRDGAVSVRVSRGGAIGFSCARPVACADGEGGPLL